MLNALKQAASLWIANTYGYESLMDRKNRAARVFEEAAELLQAEGGDLDFARRIIERTYSRPVGEPEQEAAGVLFTLLAWSVPARVDIGRLCGAEIDRVQAMPADHFRRKHAEKFAAGTDISPVQPLTNEDHGAHG